MVKDTGIFSSEDGGDAEENLEDIIHKSSSINWAAIFLLWFNLVIFLEFSNMKKAKSI